MEVGVLECRPLFPLESFSVLVFINLYKYQYGHLIVSYEGEPALVVLVALVFSTESLAKL